MARGKGRRRPTVVPSGSLGGCSWPGCPDLALSRVDGVYLCGRHAFQARYQVRQQELEQEGNETIFAANPWLRPPQQQTGPVMLG